MRDGKLFFVSALVLLSACAKRQTLPMSAYYRGGEKVVYAKVQAPFSDVRYPVRFQEEILRIWVAPHVVNDKLVEGHYIYVVVSKPTWYIEPKQPPKQ